MAKDAESTVLKPWQRRGAESGPLAGLAPCLLMMLLSFDNKGLAMLYQSKCDRILQQLLTVNSLKRVIVFGSSVNGKKRANDLDFLIVIKDNSDCRALARLLYRTIDRAGISVDFIVITEHDYYIQRDAFWSVVSEAHREGKELYVAAAAGDRQGVV